LRTEMSRKNQIVPLPSSRAPVPWRTCGTTRATVLRRTFPVALVDAGLLERRYAFLEEARPVGVVRNASSPVFPIASPSSHPSIVRSSASLIHLMRPFLDEHDATAVVSRTASRSARVSLRSA
jgi:hypothetical protein